MFAESASTDARNGGQEAACSQSSSTDGLARPFLEAIGLGVYTEAFKVAGYDTQQQLACLTEQDLNAVERQSHIPILPAHRQRILEASRCHDALQVRLVMLLSAAIGVKLTVNCMMSSQKKINVRACVCAVGWH
jgi:hypothetical protein